MRNIKQLEKELEYYKQFHNDVSNSKGWKLILFIRRISHNILPKDSIIRRVISRIVSKFFSLFKVIKFRLRSRAQIKINANAKKIAYIDHSYHLKTMSTVFLSDYLAEKYDVELIEDTSWENGIKPDLSHIDDKYLATIFFQQFPSPEQIIELKGKNVILIPMYDSQGFYDFEYWKQFADMKILNFSKTLHLKLKKWGFKSFYIQRFPEPLKVNNWGNNNEVFFYNRNAYINIDTCEKLFGDQKMKIHLHKTIDPGHEYKPPTNRQKKKYKITFSEWFEKKEDKWKKAESMSVFLAPREYEGIGQGFLEAMALGRAVIAVNNPTMNEYIKHNKTGYLFDLNNPKPLNLSLVPEIQKNAYKYMQDGYRKWLKERSKIIDFIQQKII